MKKNILIAVSVVIILGGLAYFYLQQNQPAPEPVKEQAPPTPLPPPKPEVSKVIETPAAPLKLPALAESDSFVIKALAALISNESLMKLFHTERVIHNMVATIDNLTSRRLPTSVTPLERPAGKFVTAGKENNLTISPRNADRYTPYVNIAEAVNAKKLVELYVRLYPLFQEAYEKLGYPNKYFNDRLIETLDNLLAAPDIKEPVKLVQPNVFYLFADPDLEERSIGQRILMRTGNKSEAIIKGKLREVKQELLLHMHDKKLANIK